MRLHHLRLEHASFLVVTHTSMTDSSIVDFYSDLVRLWCLDLDFLDGEIFACFPGHCSLPGIVQTENEKFRRESQPCKL